MSTPLVAIVILNTNKREDTLACLASLRESQYANAKIIVLDNASTDGSVEAIRAQFPAVQILPLTDNRGYVGNDNVGGAGLLMDAEDDVALARHLTQILTQPAEAERLRQLGFARVAQYSWPKVAAQILHSYEHALAL